ncbi:MAG: DUF1385 domain-containing protein, partial [Christensenellaceae bacterium]|nr:DUF1385 domain-containing protein [Christensenellaceae bacterium]
TMDAAKLSEQGEDEFQPNRFEKFVAKKTGKSALDVMMAFAVVIALVLAVGLFFVLPMLITTWLKGDIKNPLVINLIDGGVRICIFMLYMILVAQMKEIKGVFRYHGAEHKTVSCYEHDEELTVENVRKYKTLHPRCGTSYLLLVMIVTILIYSCLGWNDNVLLRFGSRLVLLPVISGVAYEILKFAAKGDNLFFRIIRWPGMQLQRLTTAQPTDDQIQVAILAFETALGEKTAEELEEMRRSFDLRSPEEIAKAEAKAAEQQQEQTEEQTGEQQAESAAAGEESENE